MKAVITAGGVLDDAYANLAGVRVKALAPVRGTTMLARAIGALRASGVTRIAVVGGEAVRASCEHAVDRVIDASASGAENVSRALRAWPDDDQPLLYCTSDLPYLDAPALTAFLARIPPDCLAMPLTSIAAFRERFPDAPPYGITLGNERVVNGGVFFIPAGASVQIEARARRLFDARKAPWRMAMLVGPRFLMRLALRRLTVAHLEEEAIRVLGFPAFAVRNAAPELAYDADTVEEYRYACDRA